MYFRQGIEKESFKEKSILFGYSGFLLGFSLSILFSFLSLLFFPTSYTGQSFYTDVSTTNFFSGIFANLSNFFYYFGALVCILVYEINFKRTKYIFSILFFVMILSIFLIPINSPLWFISNLLTFTFGGGVYFLILIKYTLLSQLENKVYASYIFLGVYLTGLVYSMVNNIGGISSIFSIIPIIMVITGLVFLLPLFVSPKNYISTLKYWSWILIIVIIIQISYMSLSFVLIGNPIDIVSISFLILFIIIASIVIRHLRQFFKSSVIRTDKVEVPNILGVFTRPERITEKEVAVSKERKICLVCKGTGLRFTYICPECNAIYCQKCARALSEMENACWVCNIPFDKSKPVNLPEKVEEEAVIKEDLEKKSKK